MKDTIYKNFERVCVASSCSNAFDIKIFFAVIFSFLVQVSIVIIIFM